MCFLTGQSPDISTFIAMSYFIGIANNEKEREFIGEGEKGTIESNRGLIGDEEDEKGERQSKTG